MPTISDVLREQLTVIDRDLQRRLVRQGLPDRGASWYSRHAIVVYNTRAFVGWFRSIDIVRAAICAACIASTNIGSALAHPHVFVDFQAEILFDSQGRMTHVRNVWRFDRAFSAYATQGLDKDGDGKLSDKELAPLAKINVDSLKSYAFFTYLTVNQKRLKLDFPDQYFLRIYDGRLTLFFQLPLAVPMTLGATTTLEIYDPEYFVAFTFAKKDPVTLYQAPPGCSAQFHRPPPLDAGMVAKLAAVPAEQHDLPPELQVSAVDLSNVITVTCAK